MVRKLPGVYTSIFDLSAFPEGDSSLSVGIVLRANKGTFGEAVLNTNPTDFLSAYFFNGQPAPQDDKTAIAISAILAKTNMLYVSRVAHNPKFGGSVIKREIELGAVTEINAETKTITVDGEVTAIVAGDKVRLYGTDTIDGRYTVASVTYSAEDSETAVVVTEALEDPGAYTGLSITLYKTAQPVALKNIQIGTVDSVATKQIIVTGDKADKFHEGDLFEVRGSETTGLNAIYTVVSAEYNDETNKTSVVTEEAVTQGATTGNCYRNSLEQVEGYSFETDDLTLITGVDQGAYNGDITYNIISSTETPEELAESDVFQITFYNAKSGTQLEQYTVSRDESAKSLDGNLLYIEDVINGNSNYVQVLNNTTVDENSLPCNTTSNARLSGGSDGTAPTEFDYIAALEPFKDKALSISILGNGECTTKLYQQNLLSTAITRQDVVAFLNTRKQDETAKLASKRVTNIVNYKKQELGSTSYFGTMYANYANMADVFNSRQVQVGCADGVAIPGWLDVIYNQGFSFAYAGVQDGLVSGVTTDWKIGDTSGEATLLNDASINYIAFDPKVGEYYMQCQNTLQVANSALRNLGAVFNILQTKEVIATNLKQFLQKKITDTLRGNIVKNVTLEMERQLGAERYTNYTFVDVSTSADIADNTLKFVLTLAPVGYAQRIYLTMNVVNMTYFDFAITQSA